LVETKSNLLNTAILTLLALAYNLFTNQDFYEFENGKKYYISPLEIFSGIDESGYKLAKNAIDIRLNFY